MDVKKGTVILVSIALILAITAIILNVTSDEVVPTTPTTPQIDSGSGDVGINVEESANIEDKGIGDLA